MARQRATRVPGRLRAMAGWVLVVLFLAMVALWAALGFSPGLVDVLPEPLRAFGDPAGWWPLAAAGLVGGGAAWALAPALRAGSLGASDSGGVSPLAVAVLAPAALLLTFAAYWPCRTDGSPFWVSLRRAIEALDGTVAEPFGETPGCPAQFPQPLLAGILFGRVTLVLVLGIGLAYVLRHSIDALRARLARQVVVVAGVSEETADVVRWVGDPEHLTRRQHLVILDAGPELERARDIARELRRRSKVTVLPLDVTDSRSVDSFIRARGRRGIHGLYLMSPDGASNLAALDAFLAAHDRYAGARQASEVPGRVVVRVDNPWHADDWRRRRMVGRPGWLFDALSEGEVAARHVVAHLTAHQPAIDRVVIPGADPFSLAVLAELAFGHRVDDVLDRTSRQARAAWEADGARPHPFEPHVRGTPAAVLVGSQAEVVAEHFRDQMRRFGLDGAEALAEVLPETAEAAMDLLLAEGRSPALVVDGSVPVTAEHDPTFLAVRHPGWPIVAWDPRARGLADEPLLGGLLVVGPTMAPAVATGLDVWDRLGAVQHRAYLLAFRGGRPAAGDERRTRGAWAELSAFARESNIRSFATFARTVGSLPRARRLGTDLGPSGSQRPAPLSDDEIEVLAAREHESWVAHHAEHGYSYGPERRGLRHPDMVEWDALSPADREKDVANVRATDALLRALGFVLVAAP